MTPTYVLISKLKRLPDSPGVYIFKDEKGKVLYVGKAASLRKRVASYFQSKSALSPKILAMVQKISDFDFFVTDNEREALLLEVNLIKKYRPPFNVTYRDDKSYPYIALTVKDEYPRITVTRETHKKGVEYYGPYTKAYAIRDTLELLRKLFPLRSCTNAKMRQATKKGSPCLEYHIKHCMAPCIGNISSEEYKEIVNEVRLFLKGHYGKTIEKLEEKMREAAKKLEFEKAALLRDRIKEAKEVLGRQKVVLSAPCDEDFIGIAKNNFLACVKLFMVREGKLSATSDFVLRLGADDVLSAFLKEYYLNTSFIPPKIFVPHEFEERKLLEKELKEIVGRKVTFYVPKRGEKRKLLELAEENARYTLEMEKTKRHYQKEVDLKALKELMEELSLPHLPEVIECFDISNIGGKEAVGSLVVFRGGEPEKRSYRRFKIKEVAGQNDVAMMAEVIRRRFKRYLARDKGFERKPNLVLVDGGKPQLSAVLKSLKELGLYDVSVAALAKKEEEVYVPHKKEPILLPSYSYALYLLKRVRDEAHRFALSYHRLLRGKKAVSSALDKISGIGEVRKEKLIRHFGSLEGVMGASLEDIKKVLPEKVARRVYQSFHS